MPTEISNGESGLSVRTKLNTLFNQVEVDQENRLVTAESKLATIEPGADVTDATNVASAGALMDSELADEAGIKAYITPTYASRALLVAAVAGGTIWPDGTIISDSKVLYQVSAGATAIADLPNFIPFSPDGKIPVDCFAQLSDRTLDFTTYAQEAVDYLESATAFGVGGVVQFGRGLYRIEGLRVSSNGITLAGQGRNATEIRNTSGTAATFHFEATDSLTTTVERCAVENLLFFNTASNPTTSVHVKAVRAKVTVRGCEINNAFRGIEFHGNPQGTRILDTDITQGSNTSGGLQSGSCAVALLRAQVSAPTTVDPGVAKSDPAAPHTVVGVWDASSGSFPSGASLDDVYRVSVAGTVDGVTFAVGDYLEAETASPSTTTYAANWLKTAALYYTEPNVIQIDNCDFESNSNGMDAVIFITCGDGVQVSNSHLGFGVNSIVELSPIQSLIDFNAISFNNVFFDPNPTFTDYCVWVRNRYGVASSTLGSIKITNCDFGSPLLDGVRIEFDCDRVVINSNVFKNCGAYGVYVNDGSVDDLIITDNVFFNTNASGGTAAAIYIASCGSCLIDGNSIRTGYRGIQLAATDGVVIGASNSFENLSDRSFLMATAMPTDTVVPDRCRVQESNAIGSANDLNPHIGHNFFTVSGTTTIQTIRSTSPNVSINGRTITLRFLSNPMVTHNFSTTFAAGDIVLIGATNWTPTAGDCITLRCVAGVWYEISRAT